MIVIGHMAAKLTANAGGFAAGFADAGRSVHGFLNNIENLKRLLTVGLIGEALHKTSEAVEHVVDSVSKTKQLSERFGVPVAQLESFAFAGEKVHLSLEDMTAAMSQFIRRMGDAKGGAGEVNAALVTLGLSAESLTMKNPVDAMIEVGQRLQAIRDPYKIASIAQDLFGRGGTRLFNVIKQQPDLFVSVSKELRRIGYTMDETSAGAMERLHGSTVELGYAFSGLERTFVSTLAPAITILKEFAYALVSSAPSMDLFKAVALDIGIVVYGLTVEFAFLASGIMAVVSALEALAVPGVAAAEIIGNLTKAGADLISGKGVDAWAILKTPMARELANPALQTSDASGRMFELGMRGLRGRPMASPFGEPAAQMDVAPSSTGGRVMFDAEQGDQAIEELRQIHRLLETE